MNYEKQIDTLFKISRNNAVLGYTEDAEFYTDVRKSIKELLTENERIRKQLEKVKQKRNTDIDYDRAITLLKACYKLLEKQSESYYVLNLLRETVYYNGADCDGYCLMDDIEDLFLGKVEDLP